MTTGSKVEENIMNVDKTGAPIQTTCKTKEPEDFHNNRIYVSNIPFSYREPELLKLFSPYGVVEDAMVVTNERGSKGFGFVTMDSRASCERARIQLHGKSVGGRVIEVRKATPAVAAPRRGGTANGSSTGAGLLGAAPRLPVKLADPQQQLAAALIAQQQQQQQQAAAAAIALKQNELLSAAASGMHFLPSLGQTQMPMMSPTLPLNQQYFNLMLPSTAGLGIPMGATGVPYSQAYHPQQYVQTAGGDFVSLHGVSGMAPYGMMPLGGFGYGLQAPPRKTPSPVQSNSLNQSMMNQSMAAHTQLMKDQLVNLLQLDASLMHDRTGALSSYRNMSGISLGHSSTDSSMCERTGSGMRKRHAEDPMYGGKVNRM